MGCEQEQRCTTETNLVPETTYEDQCSDKVTKVCEQVAQVASVPSVAIASYASAPTVSSVVGSPLSLAPSPPVSALTTSPLLSQLYRGKRDADADPQYFINAPSTIVKTTPVCKDVITKECQKVPKTTTRAVPSQKCISVPKCKDVPHCVEVPVPRCAPKTTCESVPKCSTRPLCNDETRPVCRTVSKPIQDQV